MSAQVSMSRTHSVAVVVRVMRFLLENPQANVAREERFLFAENERACRFCNFRKECIKTIYQLNHEVGYHYEVLNESGGDIQKAIDLFSKHLAEFRSFVPIDTICQHGGFLGEDTASSFKGLFITTWKIINGKMKLDSFRSNDIWSYAKMKNFGLLGEAYLSLDFNKILYLSDTGLRWDGYKNRVLDVVDTDYYKEKQLIARKTDDLLQLIKAGKYEKMNLLMHPANWIDPVIPWCQWHVLQVFRNLGKRIALK